MINGRDTASEFQEIRAETWAAARWWLLLMLIGAIGGFFVGDLDDNSSSERWAVGLLFFAMFAVPIVRLTYIVRSLYRCPSCSEVPMEGWLNIGPSSFGAARGVALSPRQCPNCGAKLK